MKKGPSRELSLREHMKTAKICERNTFLPWFQSSIILIFIILANVNKYAATKGTHTDILFARQIDYFVTICGPFITYIGGGFRLLNRWFILHLK